MIVLHAETEAGRFWMKIKEKRSCCNSSNECSNPEL